MLVKFRRWVRENRVAAVWFNQLPALRYFGRALPRGGPPLIYHAHGFTSAAEIGSRTARWLSRRAAAVVAVSRVTADFLVEAGVTPGKVRIIYNAIDAERVRMLAKQDGPPLPEKPSGAVVFLHAATLNREKKAQHLAIEALGIVNDPCKLKGLSGEQGALIPGANVQHLMLREEVVEAVRQGQFRVHCVTTIDEGIEILTGVAAGQREKDGKFPKDSINGRVEARLRSFAMARHEFLSRNDTDRSNS
jgi:glycosyltransferase involved in cell wall biosynthesis